MFTDETNLFCSNERIKPLFLKANLEFFGQTSTQTEPTKMPTWLTTCGEIFKISASRYSKNALPGCLFLDLFVKH